MAELGPETLSTRMRESIDAPTALFFPIDEWADEAELLEERIRSLKDGINMLPCLDKAAENGGGVVPVPEWVIFEIAKLLPDSDPGAA